VKRSKAKLMLGALAMAVATPAGAPKCDAAPLPPTRPAELTPAPPPKSPAPPAPSPGPGGAAQTCLSTLIASGAHAEVATAPSPTAEGCGIAAPIRLSSVRLASGDVVALPDKPILECEFALVFADYVRMIVAPLGGATLGAKVSSIETGPGYECRTRDHVAGGKISAHGKGLALDLVAIELANKRRVLVERQVSGDEASYFRAVRMAACGWFTTVLGPGADAFHATNMHIDSEKHGSSDSYRICQ
jgi:hypothetical protein